MSKKSDTTEFNERVFIISQLILRGLQRKEIIQYVTTKVENPWDIKDRQIDRYISEARKEIQVYSDYEKSYERGKALLRLDNLYSRLYNIQDYKGALQVQKELNDLTGIKEAQKHDITSKGEKIHIILPGEKLQD